MKTQILRLEPHDDIVSATDKMGWGQAARILLIWPESGGVLNRRLDLVLLQRRSTALGAQLALVTHDGRVRFYARQLGIPVFKTLRKAQNAHWRLERRFRKNQPLHGLERFKRETAGLPERTLPERPASKPASLTGPARLAFFTLGVLALLALAAVLLPQAEVSLASQVETQEISFEVQASPRASEVSLTGILPARWETMVVEGRDEMPSSGWMHFPIQAAAGEVRFTNLTDQPIVISSGNLVRTQAENALRFVTTQSGTLPAGLGQVLVLPVQAQTPGSQGNQPAGSLLALEGALGTQVSVTNPLPIRGGKDRQVPAPSEADRRMLAERLRAALQQTALQELQASLSPGDLLLSSNLEISQTFEETFDPPKIEPADLLSLSLRLEFRVLAASSEDLQLLAGEVLDANLPAGFSPVPGSLNVKNQTRPTPGADSRARWQVNASRQLQASLSQAQAVKIILGLPPARAQQRLAADLPLEAPPRITLTPSWWPVMPVVPFRIKVSGE